MKDCSTASNTPLTMKAMGWAHNLIALGYTREALEGISERHAMLREDPQALAVRLFRDRGTVTPEQAAALRIPRYLLQRGHGGIASKFRMDIAGGLLLAADWDRNQRNASLAPGQTTALLYRAAQKFPGGALLDTGCGGGALALLLAAGHSRVTATDINARAIALAKRNARGNGIQNVEFLKGDLFEPVAGRKFRLIVSQPPFLPSSDPAARHIFLQAGKRGDELARRLLQEVADYLAEGGTALIFSDWMLRAEESLSERLPRTAASLSVFRSPPVLPDAYVREYGLPDLESHLDDAAIAQVVQALIVIRPGAGLRERIVLPHEWAGIADLM